LLGISRLFDIEARLAFHLWGILQIILYDRNVKTFVDNGEKMLTMPEVCIQETECQRA